MKKILRSRIFAFILGAIIFGSIGVMASQFNAKQIMYNPSDNTWKKSNGEDINNVKEAIDELYTKRNAYNEKPYVTGCITGYNRQMYSNIGFTTNENYFTVDNSNSDENYLSIAVKKDMKIKVIIQSAERGGSIYYKNIKINNTTVYENTLHGDKYENEYDVNANDIINISLDSGNSAKALAIFITCIEEYDN